MGWWSNKKPVSKADEDIYDPAEIQLIEKHANIAMRATVAMMAEEGLISKDVAKEYVSTHAVVVAYKERGFSNILRRIGMKPDDVAKNHSRLTVMKLPSAPIKGGMILNNPDK